MSLNQSRLTHSIVVSWLVQTLCVTCSKNKIKAIQTFLNSELIWIWDQGTHYNRTYEDQRHKFIGSKIEEHMCSAMYISSMILSWCSILPTIFRLKHVFKLNHSVMVIWSLHWRVFGCCPPPRYSSYSHSENLAPSSKRFVSLQLAVHVEVVLYVVVEVEIDCPPLRIPFSSLSLPAL